MNVTEDGEVRPIYRTFEQFFKTPYNHDTRAESMRYAQINLEPTKTQQHQEHEANINTIVKNFGITGKLPVLDMPPSYEAFGEIFDFQSAMNTVKAAQDNFMALPANVRAQFQNDPGVFVAYVDHCLENGDIDPLREMGLAVEKRKEPAPAPTPNPTPPTPPPSGGPGDKGPPGGPKS